MSTELRVLLVEDSEDDAIFVLRELRRGGYDPISERVDTPEAMNAALDQQEWSLIVSDYAMPRFSMPAALAMVKEKGLDVPFIIVSGAIGEEAAVAAMRAGAHDYVMKGNLARLIPVIERELREAEMRHEHKRMEEERQRMEQQLQLTGRLAAVGELAAGVAHELNNPLAAVQAYAQLLAARDDLDETVRSDVETIYKEAQRASRITGNLLSFARKHKAERSLISINDALAQSLDLYAYHMKVNNIEVSVDFDPNLPKTMADSHQMQQVFVNIITNAEQAMTEANNEGNLTVKTEKVKDMIQITIADDGPGIQEENLDRMFDPFFTTKEVGKGTGLGLSICYGIVEGHGGRLYAKSKSSKGATFIIELPIVSEISPLLTNPT
ncbi:MAG: ATP-binding protein [Dehalococcoidia bacterium]